MRLALLLIIVLVLAGCVRKPPVPEDAVTLDGDGSLAGLRLSAWIEDKGDRLRLSALLEATSGVHQVRKDCGRPWNSTIIDHEGEPIQFMDRLYCPEFYYEDLRAGQFLEYRYSWDLQEHDLTHRTAEPVPAGDYLWILAVDTVTKGALTVQVPFTVAGQADNATPDADPDPLAGLHVMAWYNDTSRRLDALVENRGAPVPYSRGCQHEWSVAMVDAEDEPVAFRPPMGTCAGFAHAELQPGESLQFNVTWTGRVYGPGDWKLEDGQPAPAGEYTWIFTFYTGEGQHREPSVSARVTFEHHA